jgi:hypothetical protein
MALSVWRTVTPKGSGSEGRPRSSLRSRDIGCPPQWLPGENAKSENLANRQPPPGNQAGIGCVTDQSLCLAGLG